MSDFLPPDPPSPPNPGNPENAPPPGGGSFGGPPPGGFGGPPGAFGAPPGGGMYAPPPPPKMSSNTKGCLVALAVLFGVGALCTCTGLGIASYTVYSNPELRRAVAATGDIVALMQEGMQDPGAQALVGAGCQQAIAFPLDRFVGIMREIDPDNAPEEPGPDSPELVVTCTLGGAARSCDELARVFVGAHTPAPRSFAMTVQTMATNQQLCANLYGPSGELLRPLDAGERYDVPK